MKLLVKLPTRERPQRALTTVRGFVASAASPERMRIVVSLDSNDGTITEDFVRSLKQLGAEVNIGKSSGKVDAINRNITGDFDVLVVIADDITPNRHWDNKIRADMGSLWPNLDGAIHYNDGFVADRLCTIPVMGVNLYRKFNYIYNPDYTSLWCDNEYTDILRAFGRLPYIATPIMRHLHPSHPGGHPADDLFRRTESFFYADQITYNRRKKMIKPSSFVGFGSPEISLTIGMCALSERDAQRRILLAGINHQIEAIEEPLRVEIIIVVDGGQIKVGQKRQDILNRAKGRFIAFVDDDDMVSLDYIKRIVRSIDKNKEADCISLNGIFHSPGNPPKSFQHSIAHKTYFETPDAFCRPPNHLNPIKTSRARMIGFGPKQCGEDFDYAMGLVDAGVLKVETDSGAEPLYHYQYNPLKTRTQQG